MKKVLFMTLVAALTFATQSCSNNDEPQKDLVQAVVTVKKNDAGSTYLQIDDNTKAFPTNFKFEKFGNEVRALCVLSDFRESNATDYACEVEAIDSIRTKDVVTYQTGMDLSKYGNDPLDIVASFISVLEDGYLTLHIRSMWGTTGIKHYLNLIEGVDPDHPEVVELRQDFNGDVPYGALDSYAAFRLKSLANAKKIIVRYNSVFHGGTHDVVFTRGTALTSVD